MLQGNRGQFQSRFGFIMAAAGSAVGLGNIWGFPTQTASNGGAAFVLVYLLLAFCLAYPVLLAEFTLGRHGHSNSIDALLRHATGSPTRLLAWFTGLWGILAVSAILAFYAVVGGWIFAFLFESPLRLVGADDWAQWVTGFSTDRNLLFMSVFMALTGWVVSAGIQDGIERLCSRLMPALFVMMILLIGYVLTLDGAAEGVRAYLVPDFSHFSAALILDALGQAFFSLSLGVGTMLIYASYLPDDSHLPRLAAMVTLADVSVAVLAGLLIMPAMYVAMQGGVDIFDDTGALLSGDTLVFQVLPALFDSMGGGGVIVSITFFLLLSFAALTSSVSMLEVAVAALLEKTALTRRSATFVATASIAAFSALIVLNFEQMFGLVVSLATQYSQPLIGLLFCVFVGWIWQRSSLLEQLSRGDDAIRHSLFARLWPGYVRYVCPAIIAAIVWQSVA